MATTKRVLTLGIEPSLIDFSHPEFANLPPMNAEKVLAGLKASEETLTQQGYTVHTCLIDLGETAEDVVRTELGRHGYDAVMIGAGVRALPSNFLLFEKLINVIHEYAPKAKICFNTKPSDSAEAVQRWV